MLKIHDYTQLSPADLHQLVQRNVDEDNRITDTVQGILEHVRQQKDAALYAYNKQFDRAILENFVLEGPQIQEIAMRISRLEQRALEIAFSNIHKFHSLQRKRERRIETMPGVTCWRELRPIERVGLYVPGGSAVLPSTLLMLGVPARIAGCKELVVCTPPDENGSINPAIAYCLHLLQIEKIYLIGGAQAVAAMAYGTETVPAVHKIFGPGNQYVTRAKSIIQSTTRVAIDMPAGPSEVLVIADPNAKPAFVAADLIAQAEHGADSQAILVSWDKNLIEQTGVELEKQLATLPRAELARAALDQSYAVWVPGREEAIAFSNLYAPEHLILSVEDTPWFVPKILNAGSVFLGYLSAESMGDYASGTNHTLPTSAYAQAYSGVSVDSFVKKITFQEVDQIGLQQLGPTVEILARLEALEGHARAVSVRLHDEEM